MTSRGRFDIRHQSAAVLLVWAVASAVAIALLCAQFMRPTPLGSPYVLDRQHYFWYAILYELFGLALLSLPFLLLSAIRRRERDSGWLAGLQIALLACSLFASQWNHELQRFMGAQLSLDHIVAYARIDRTPEVIWQALRDDHGGAYSALWWYLTTPLFVLLACVAPRFAHGITDRRRALPLAGCFVVLGLLVPAIWLSGSTGRNRKGKLRPPLVLLMDSWRSERPGERRFAHIADEVQRVQAEWLAVDGSGRCRFADPDHPLRHSCETPTASPLRPNIIVLSLETFRAWDMASFNPSVKYGPTPFLDELATGAQCARYTHYIANGIPTIYAFMSMQTGTLPHSWLTAARAFTSTQLDAFPALARERGYRTLFFTAADPDWDNQRYWLDSWYDEMHYDPADHEIDRAVFRGAARRLIEVGQTNRPFVATIASISNHTPFHSPEAAFDISTGSRAVDHLHNTMHYTDDVVREFVETLRTQPWFSNTVLFITGDHGFDLGDRGVQVGHDNLHHESDWVPLIVCGDDSRLPRGEQLRPASHIDLGPTIAELVGHPGPYAFLGHSLLTPIEPTGIQVAVHDHNLGIETDAYSAYVPISGRARLYAGDDRQQKHDIAATSAGVVQGLKARAKSLTLVTDWAFEHDRFAPKPAMANHSVANR